MKLKGRLNPDSRPMDVNMQRVFWLKGPGLMQAHQARRVLKIKVTHSFMKSTHEIGKCTKPTRCGFQLKFYILALKLCT